MIKNVSIVLEKDMLTTTSIREKLEKKFAPGWGEWISCDRGWDWILEDLDGKLSYLDPKYKLNQVKEKFGTLRFYYESTAKNVYKQELMHDAVTIAEMLSASTCEICGNSSRISNAYRGIKYDSSVGLKERSGWYKTLCNGCADTAGYEAKVED